MRGVSSTRIGAVDLMVWLVGNAKSLRCLCSKLVYGFVDDSVKKSVVVLRETEDTRCAMQHHAYPHMHVHCRCGVGHISGHGISALSHAYVVHESSCVRHVLRCLANTIQLNHFSSNKTFPNQSGKLFDMLRIVEDLESVSREALGVGRGGHEDMRCIYISSYTKYPWIIIFFFNYLWTGTTGLSCEPESVEN